MIGPLFGKSIKQSYIIDSTIDAKQLAACELKLQSRLYDLENPSEHRGDACYSQTLHCIGIIVRLLQMLKNQELLEE